MQGDGVPPSEARDFCDWLAGDVSAMTSTHFAVCALGDRYSLLPFTPVLWYGTAIVNASPAEYITHVAAGTAGTASCYAPPQLMATPSTVDCKLCLGC